MGTAIFFAVLMTISALIGVSTGTTALVYTAVVLGIVSFIGIGLATLMARTRKRTNSSDRTSESA